MTKHSGTIKFALALTLGMASVACSRDVGHRPHSAPVGVADAGPSETPRSESRETPLAPLAEKPASDAAALVSRAESLLDPKSLGADQRRLRRPEIAREVNRLSLAVAGLLEAAARQRQDAAANGDVAKILAAYERAMTDGCDERLNGCLYVDFFRRDPAASRIARAIAATKSNLEARYRLLRLTYALKNGARDEALDLAYLAKAKTWSTELARRGDTASREALREHTELTLTLLGRLAVQPGFRLPQDIEKEFDPWSFATGQEGAPSAVDDAVLDLAVRTGLYLPSEGQSNAAPVLDPSFRERIRVLAERPTGLVKRLEAIKAKNPSIFRSFELADTAEQNEYFFIFENLYEGAISLNNASSIWKGTRQDVAAARKALETYVRFRFLLLALEANYGMQEFFARTDSFTPQSLLDDTFRHSETYAQRWQDGFARLERMKLFFERHFTDNTEDSRRLASFFAGAGREVKYISTYPIMLMAAYKLAKIDFVMEVPTWTGIIRIDGPQILTWFFKGESPPWFKFSEDRNPLTKAQISLAFLAALKMGLMESGGITYGDFFRVAIGQTLQARGTMVSERIEEMRKWYTANQPDFTSFIRACRDLERPGHFPLERTNIEELGRRAYMGQPMGPIGEPWMTDGLASANALFDDDRIFRMREGGDAAKRHARTMVDTVEYVRLEFTPALEQMTMLAGMIETHLKDTKPEAEANRLIGEMRAVLGPFERMRSEFYGRWISLHDQVSGCLDAFYDEEFASQKILLSAFVKKVREVHGEMTRARAQGSSSPSKVFDFSSRPETNFPGLAEHEVRMGFDQNAFRYSKVQLLLFFKSILETGTQLDSGPIAARRAPGTYVLPQKLTDLNPGLLSLTSEIRYKEDVEEFIGDVMRDFVSRRAPNTSPGDVQYVVWLDIGGLGLRPKNRVQVLSAVYKAGEVPALACTGNACSEESGRKARITADVVIDTTLKVAKRLELDDEWLKILRYAGLRWRLQSNEFVIDEWAFNLKDRRYRSVLDFPFRNVLGDIVISFKQSEAQADEQGTSSESSMNSIVGRLEEARRYVISERQLKSGVLSLSPAMAERLRQIYIGPAIEDLRLRSEFIRAVAKRAESPSNTFAWRIHYDRRTAEPMPLLSSGLIDDFRAKTRLFVQDTGLQLPNDILNRP